MAKLINFRPEPELFVGTTSDTEPEQRLNVQAVLFLLDHFTGAVHSTAMQKLHHCCS